MGDAAFLLIASEPQTGIFIIILGFVVGVMSGWFVDLTHPKNYLTPKEKNISVKEKGLITDDAIKLIARTSEGSVRDSISLLDRALISQSIKNNTIEEQDVRNMLGLADRSKVISLFKEILEGKEKDALKILQGLSLIHI